ncbi:helicase RepA family protein [Oceanicella sp. SM1341]|uniref:helicase RepA family protein n=1 Tax=Oceanicella sp. SM1341 TaxID=1548889 RepID=UPI001300318B|nr:helicase RepA family protein [Oceanicella sp. SM1341]
MTLSRIDVPGHDRPRPARGDPARLKPRARALLDATVWAAHLAPCLERPYLVKGWLDRGTLSVLYGPSNSGKSFLALDLAHHVSKGQDWDGNRVRHGRVLYVAAEGGGGFANRLAAFEAPELFLLPVQLSLTGAESAAVPLAEVLEHLAAVGGAGIDLIVIDTMARVMGGGDENAAPDIAELVHNLDLIRRASGAHVLLVHHSGKDVARGARGHSALRAAIDTEIELSRDEAGQITAEVTKQRDGPTGLRFSYHLRQVELGRDQDGDVVTTCRVDPVASAQAGHAGVSEVARKALSLLDRLIGDDGAAALGPWRDACMEEGVLSASSTRDTRKRAFNRCREELERRQAIRVRDTTVWRL